MNEDVGASFVEMDRQVPGSQQAWVFDDFGDQGHGILVIVLARMDFNDSRESSTSLY
jgi:hypothetical protein